MSEAFAVVCAITYGQIVPALPPAAARNHSGLCKFDHELGYQFGCRIVLNDEPELLAGGVKRS